MNEVWLIWNDDGFHSYLESIHLTEKLAKLERARLKRMRDNRFRHYVIGKMPLHEKEVVE